MHKLEGQRLRIWSSVKKRIHLGDAIAALNSGIYVAKRHGLSSVQLSVAYVHYRRGNLKFLEELLEFIDYGDLDVSIVPSTEEEMANENFERTATEEMAKLGVPHQGRNYMYDAPYCSAKIPRATQIQQKICYCWGAKYRKDEVPENINELTDVLRREFSFYEFEELGLPKTVKEDLRALSDCYFYIGFDSGVAHLCRLMGAPLFLLGDMSKQNGGFPEHACERLMLNVKDVWADRDSFLRKMHNYLEKVYGFYGSGEKY